MPLDKNFKMKTHDNDFDVSLDIIIAYWDEIVSTGFFMRPDFSQIIRIHS